MESVGLRGVICRAYLKKFMDNRLMASKRMKPQRPLIEIEAGSIKSLLLGADYEGGRIAWLGRLALLLALFVWGWHLVGLPYQDESFGESFIHAPLLIFHEAGHIVFMPFGEWVMVLGGTLGQLLMPAVLSIALLYRNRDAFGAAIGLWLFGVSLMDVAPYAYDALDPKLMLLSGTTGEEGGPHDWIFLLQSMGKLSQAHAIGKGFHVLGATVTFLAVLWASIALTFGRRSLRADDDFSTE